MPFPTHGILETPDTIELSPHPSCAARIEFVKIRGLRVPPHPTAANLTRLVAMDIGELSNSGSYIVKRMLNLTLVSDGKQRFLRRSGSAGLSPFGQAFVAQRDAAKESSGFTSLSGRDGRRLRDFTSLPSTPTPASTVDGPGNQLLRFTSTLRLPHACERSGNDLSPYERAVLSLHQERLRLDTEHHRDNTALICRRLELDEAKLEATRDRAGPLLATGVRFTSPPVGDAAATAPPAAPPPPPPPHTLAADAADLPELGRRPCERYGAEASNTSLPAPCILFPTPLSPSPASTSNVTRVRTSPPRFPRLSSNAPLRGVATSQRRKWPRTGHVAETVVRRDSLTAGCGRESGRRRPLSRLLLSERRLRRRRQAAGTGTSVTPIILMRKECVKTGGPYSCRLRVPAAPRATQTQRGGRQTGKRAPAASER